MVHLKCHQEAVAGTVSSSLTPEKKASFRRSEAEGLALGSAIHFNIKALTSGSTTLFKA
ncbi:hypothetical protein OIU77_011065 [Salix suchowensis]|uniref:Uncharacterized protein n=1 Tax=Salix suchowensis TaxID=1278906 RepID=A0ABQ9AAH4_9ROSI|nr:hypothetical protein OIU77_011065 [Salix suchowensis]